jgi:hypothetical protein
VGGTACQTKYLGSIVFRGERGQFPDIWECQNSSVYCNCFIHTRKSHILGIVISSQAESPRDGGPNRKSATYPTGMSSTVGEWISTRPGSRSGRNWKSPECHHRLHLFRPRAPRGAHTRADAMISDHGSPGLLARLGIEHRAVQDSARYMSVSASETYICRSARVRSNQSPQLEAANVSTQSLDPCLHLCQRNMRATLQDLSYWGDTLGAHMDRVDHCQFLSVPSAGFDRDANKF